jgi:hypothetical protein
MPGTLALLMAFMLLTAAFDFLALLALYGHVAPVVAIGARTADFMAHYIPAIELMSGFLERKGLSDQIVAYRALISVNWIFFLLFLPMITVAIVTEARKKKDKLIAYVEMKNLKLSKIIILSGIFLGAFVPAFYFGYAFTSYLVIMPAYFLVFIWSFCFALIVIWILLAISVQIYFTGA